MEVTNVSENTYTIKEKDSNIQDNTGLLTKKCTSDITIVNKVRCSFCRKKCSLMNFTCDCGGIFCSEHRYVHSHNCQQKSIKDNKMKETLEKKNPKISTEKIQKI